MGNHQGRRSRIAVSTCDDSNTRVARPTTWRHGVRGGHWSLSSSSFLSWAMAATERPAPPAPRSSSHLSSHRLCARCCCQIMMGWEEHDMSSSYRRRRCLRRGEGVGRLSWASGGQLWRHGTFLEWRRRRRSAGVARGGVVKTGARGVGARPAAPPGRRLQRKRLMW